jgi:lambda repressor-like predicted transcriptional regulator
MHVCRYKELLVRHCSILADTDAPGTSRDVWTDDMKEKWEASVEEWRVQSVIGDINDFYSSTHMEGMSHAAWRLMGGTYPNETKADMIASLLEIGTQLMETSLEALRENASVNTAAALAHAKVEQLQAAMTDMRLSEVKAGSGGRASGKDELMAPATSGGGTSAATGTRGKGARASALSKPGQQQQGSNAHSSGTSGRRDAPVRQAGMPARFRSPS